MNPCRRSKTEKRDQVVSLHQQQGGLCYYCLRDTFLPTIETFAEAAERFGMSAKTVILRMATREHLIKRQDGGTDQDFNIVMACMQCNLTREDRAVLAHVKFCRQHHGTLALSYGFQFAPAALNLPSGIKVNAATAMRVEFPLAGCTSSTQLFT